MLGLGERRSTIKRRLSLLLPAEQMVTVGSMRKILDGKETMEVANTLEWLRIAVGIQLKT